MFDNADEAMAARKLEDAERILLLARGEAWRLQRHDEMFVSLVHRGFSCGLWTMENGDQPAGQDMDAWRKEVVDAARRIADLAYPRPSNA
jgi:hypothetical protein